MVKEQYKIADVIPHSSPMVLLDHIIEQHGDELSAEITISENSRFFESEYGGVPGWVGIEYMAQAIAALAGIHSKQKNEAIKLGFLLGTRKYNMPGKIFEVGETYQINVKQLYMDDSGLASFDCQILNGDLLCVQAKLNVFETDDAQQILETNK